MTHDVTDISLRMFGLSAAGFAQWLLDVCAVAFWPIIACHTETRALAEGVPDLELMPKARGSRASSR